MRVSHAYSYTARQRSTLQESLHQELGLSERVRRLARLLVRHPSHRAQLTQSGPTLVRSARQRLPLATRQEPLGLARAEQRVDTARRRHAHAPLCHRRFSRLQGVLGARGSSQTLSKRLASRGRKLREGDGRRGARLALRKQTVSADERPLAAHRRRGRRRQGEPFHERPLSRGGRLLDRLAQVLGRVQPREVDVVERGGAEQLQRRILVAVEGDGRRLNRQQLCREAQKRGRLLYYLV